MRVLENAFRGAGMPGLDDAIPDISTDAASVGALIARCPAFRPTPLVETPKLAGAAGVAAVHVKDERGRMGLGSFKALGAAYVIARDAVATGKEDMSKALAGVTYVTASAGNHGMSVAAGSEFSARMPPFIWHRPCPRPLPKGCVKRVRGSYAKARTTKPA